MKHPSFIYETSNRKKIKYFIISIFIIISIITLVFLFEMVFYDYLKDTFLIGGVKSAIKDQIAQFTPLGLLYTSFVGGFILIPMPIEVFFYIGLEKSGNFLLSFFLVIFGYLSIQAVNYWIGLKCSPLIMNFISLKKLYVTRRFINRHGAIGIFLFNLIPSPSEFVSFGLGLAKYNFYKLFFFTALGNAVKYAAIIGIYLIIH